MIYYIILLIYYKLQVDTQFAQMNFSAKINTETFPEKLAILSKGQDWLATLTGRKILNFEIVWRNTIKDRGKPVCSAEIWNKTGQSQSLAVNAGEAWHPFPQHTCCLKALWGLFIIMTKVSPKHDFKQLFFLLKIFRIFGIFKIKVKIRFLWEGVVSQSIWSCVILEFLSLDLN